MTELYDVAGVRVGAAETSPRRRHAGLASGRVVDVLDPLALGRLLVEVPQLTLRRWARVAVPYIGHCFAPHVGDEVVVGFENGDVAAPLVLGYLWNTAAPPPQPQPLAGLRVISTPATAVEISELPPSIVIRAGGAQITVSGGAVEISVGTSLVSVSDAQVTVSGQELVFAALGSIQLRAEGQIRCEAANIAVEAGVAASVEAGVACQINAALVEIN